MDFERGLQDSLALWAQQLTPEAFQTANTAYAVTPEPDGLTEGLPRDEAQVRFAAWVDQRLDDGLTACGIDSWPTFLVYGADGRLLRRWDDCGCGRLACVMDVRAELRELISPWIVAMELRRPQLLLPDPDRPGGSLVTAPGLPRHWYAGWYAEGRGRGVATQMAGWIHMRGDHELDLFGCSVRELGEARRFERLLRGHLDRRRHPIRRI